MLATFLACLALISATLLLWQWAAGTVFPLNQRIPTPSHLPSISVLKPVTGADPGTADAITSWFTQIYPGSLEILFGVPSRQDPAHALIQGLIEQYPATPARLVVCPDNHALNRKVGKLIHLSRESHGQFLAISDADVHAPPDLLAQAATRLVHPKVGLVHCLYRLADAPTPANRWESLIVNADFWSQVLQNQSFRPLDYALGAVMVVKRQDLEAIGGFQAFSDFLADDYQLGRHITRLGLQTALCPLVVDCRAAPATWSEIWRHQLRWAVTIRVCQPVPYLLSILANGSLWPLLWFASAPSTTTATVASALLGLRIVQALSLEHQFTGKPRDWRRSGLPILKDLLQVALWALAFSSRHVVWRGAKLLVGADGRLKASPTSPPTPPSPSLPKPGSLPSSGFGIPPGSR